MRRSAHQRKYINDKAAKWIDALESGNYEQGKGELKAPSGFCCLGVACEIDPDVKYSNSDLDYAFNGYSADTELPYGYKSELGLLQGCGGAENKTVIYKGSTVRDGEGTVARSLITLNDQCSFTFKQIARVLRDTPENFFEEIK
jgi:hypothetical protein